MEPLLQVYGYSACGIYLKKLIHIDACKNRS